MPFRLQYILFLLVFVAVGCSHHSDPRLVRLEQMASSGDDSAHVALDSLRSLDPAQLSDDDRHFYDFLSVKIPDKAYVNHTSDSLILSVISHEEAHQGNGRYPEALYYGGRVYSDLGDYSTAIQYFQQALDELPDDVSHNLKGRILSQTGRLLNTLRLYKEAIPYVKGSQELNQCHKDTVSDVYDLQLLGAIYLHIDNYSAADSCFIAALAKSDNLPVSFRAKSSMYRAAVKYYTDQTDSALILIRNTPDLVKPIARNSALSYSARIYQSAGIFDSAYYYAYELINSKNFINKKTGYQILLSPELTDFVNPDTAKKYVLEYRMDLDKYLDENENQLAVMQHARYNYDLHERERTKAERDRANLLIMIALILVVVVCLIAFVYYQRYKNKSNILQLHQTLDNLKTLRESMTSDNNMLHASDNTSAQDNMQCLKDRLKDELLQLLKANGNSSFVSPDILRSEAYTMLQSFIEKNKAVPESDPMWKNLDKVVTESSNDFKYRLQLLLGGKPSDSDYNMALLIKCGVTPTQMSILLGRTKSTIAYRREKFSIKIFGQKMELSLVDKLICLL